MSDEKLFTFAFDDGYQSWPDAATALERVGWRGCFYVCLRNVVHERKEGRRRSFPPGDVLTWAEVADLQARGHEIASHGTCHVELSYANERELWLEMVASRQVFESHDIRVSSFGCCFNVAPAAAQEYALKHYAGFRGGVGRNELPLVGRTYHGQVPHEAIADIRPGRWMVGIWHDVDAAKLCGPIERVQAVPGVRVVTPREVLGDG